MQVGCNARQEASNHIRNRWLELIRCRLDIAAHRGKQAVGRRQDVGGIQRVNQVGDLRQAILIQVGKAEIGDTDAVDVGGQAAEIIGIGDIKPRDDVGSQVSWDKAVCRPHAYAIDADAIGIDCARHVKRITIWIIRVNSDAADGVDKELICAC